MKKTLLSVAEVDILKRQWGKSKIVAVKKKNTGMHADVEELTPALFICVLL